MGDTLLLAEDIGPPRFERVHERAAFVAIARFGERLVEIFAVFEPAAVHAAGFAVTLGLGLARGFGLVGDDQLCLGEERLHFADEAEDLRQLGARHFEKTAERSGKLKLARGESAAHALHEGDLDAAGEDGFEEQFGIIADEEDVGIGGRLLEGFQKGVGGIFHETVGVEEDHDFPPATQRAHLE